MPLPTAQQVHANRPLTNLSVAYFQERPPYSDMVFPRVTVDFQTDTYYEWNKGDFWRDDAALRAPATKFERIGLRITNTATYRCDQYAIEYPLADEIIKNEDAAVRQRTVATRTVTSRLIMRKDRAFAADFMTTGVWGTDKVGTTDFVKWNDATSDPSGDVQAGIEVLVNALGDAGEGMRYVAICGSIIRARLVNHPDAIDRIKYTQRATIREVDAVLGAWLGVDDFIVARRRYTTSAEGSTDAFAAVIDDDLLLVAVPSAPALETPSAGYTFEWTDDDSAGPLYVSEYRDETIKSDIVRGLCYFDQKAVATSLGYFFSDAVD